MKTEARKIVDAMYEAFHTKDLQAVAATFSEDAICIYHGTQKMPSAQFKGLEGVKMFFEFNFNQFEVVYFDTESFIEENSQVVVLGKEHFISTNDQKDYYQKWVQVYTVKNGKITRMEEFATSALPEEYGGNASVVQ
jgi:ketosteroid isomerase-like protein